MKVILLQELRGKGGEGDVVDVTRGYANNYLLRNGIAIPATKGNLKQLELRKHNIAKREETRLANAEALKAKLESASIVVPAQVGDEGQLFGSVTAPMIADALAEQGVEIDKRRIELAKPIKVVGEYPVPVSLYRDIKATLNVAVVDQKAIAEEAKVEELVEEAVAEVEAAVDEVVAEVEGEIAAEEAKVEELVEEAVAEVEAAVDEVVAEVEAAAAEAAE